MLKWLQTVLAFGQHHFIAQKIIKLMLGESLKYYAYNHEVLVECLAQHYQVCLNDMKILVSRRYHESNDALLSLNFIEDGHVDEVLVKNEQIDEGVTATLLLKLNPDKWHIPPAARITEFKTALLAKRLDNMKDGQQLKRRTKQGIAFTFAKNQDLLVVETEKGLALEFEIPGNIPLWAIAETIHGEVDAQLHLRMLLTNSNNVFIKSLDNVKIPCNCKNNWDLTSFLIDCILSNECPTVKILLKS